MLLLEPAYPGSPHTLPRKPRETADVCLCVCTCVYPAIRLSVCLERYLAMHSLEERTPDGEHRFNFCSDNRRVGILGSWSLARTGVDYDCPLVEKVLNGFVLLRP